MSGYTGIISNSFEFDGDTVKVEMKRIKRGDFLKILPLIQKISSSETSDDMQNFEVVETACVLLPNYVTTFSGLKDAANNDVDLSTFLDDVYFTELVAEVIGWWLENCSVNDEKK